MLALPLAAFTIHSPVAFNLFGRDIRWYGICIAIGFLLALWVMRKRAPVLGLHPDRPADIVLYALIGGVLGARLWYVLGHNQAYYLSHPWMILRIDEGGLVFYGGLFGGTLAVLLCTRLHKLKVWAVGDLVAVGLPLGQAIGRLGCFFNGCCYGRHTESFLGVVYDPAYNANIPSPVIPTQFFSTLSNLAIFALLWWFLAPRLKREGQLFGAMLMLYSTQRFLNELNRGDYNPSEMLLGMTPAQQVSVVLFVVGVAIFSLRTTYGQLRTEPALTPAADGDDAKAKPAGGNAKAAKADGAK